MAVQRNFRNLNKPKPAEMGMTSMRSGPQQMGITSMMTPTQEGVVSTRPESLRGNTGVYLGSHTAGMPNDTMSTTQATSTGNGQIGAFMPGANYQNDPAMTGPFRDGDPRGDSANYLNGEYTNPALQGALTQDMTALEGGFTPSELPETTFNMYAPEGNYGLAGAEEALTNAAGGQVSTLTESSLNAINAANQGFNTGRNDLSSGLNTSLGLLGQGAAQGRSDINSSLDTGLGLIGQGAAQGRSDLYNATDSGLRSLYGGISQGRNDISGQLNSGLSALRGGLSTGRNDINSATEQAVSRFDPYARTGLSALDVEAARSGALGPEAQAEAFANYQESPGQKYAREQQERALVRNAAATGGTQSGNVLSALQRQAAGIASQNYQQDLMNLRSLAERGQAASGAQAGLESQAGRDLAQMEMSAAQSELNARNNAGLAMGNMAAQGGQMAANMQQNMGNNLANIAQQAAQTGAGMTSAAGQNLANIVQNASQSGANMTNAASQNMAQMAQNAGLTEAQYQANLGNNLSNIIGNTGNNIAGLRTQAGQQIANQINQSGNQFANLQSGQGVNLANLDQQTANYIANLANQQGQQTSGLRTGLAAILANLATGQGSQQANLAQQLGNANAGGVTNANGNTAAALTNMLANFIMPTP